MLNTKDRRSSRTSRKKRLQRLVARKAASRKKVENHYDGPAGAMLIMASKFSMHEPLVGQLLKSQRFDLTRFNNILDIGSGAGQILGHLLKFGKPNARIVGFDLSHEMLRRARTRLKNERVEYVSGDMTNLPFADESFDCITCGYVIEHLPDPAPGLAEFARVLQPGGSALMLVTEDTLAGSLTSRTWHCRTINRREFAEACGEAGLAWKQELWFTPFHKFFKAGGIVVELVKNRGSI